jgi:hypothetical protein
MLMYLFGCDASNSRSENNWPIQSKISPLHESLPPPEAVVDSKLIRFDMDFGDNKLAAIVDEAGNVTISNYPAKWQGEVTLTRFDGQVGIKAPFSPAHCQNIRNMASHEQMSALVRSGYHSLISFEVPIFLSYDLLEIITKSAQAAGVNLTSFYLNNPVDKIRSKIELTLNDNAISNLIGNVETLKEQLHLGQKGMLNGPFEHQIFVYSADIICDLISGAATMGMIYSIQGESRVIKIMYEPMKVELESPQGRG